MAAEWEHTKDYVFVPLSEKHKWYDMISKAKTKIIASKIPKSMHTSILPGNLKPHKRVSGANLGVSFHILLRFGKLILLKLQQNSLISYLIQAQ